MTHFEAYLLTRLDSLSNLLVGGVILGLFLIIIGSSPLFWNDDGYGLNKAGKRTIILSFCFSILCAILNTLLPTTKEAAFIYITPAIVNNKNIQKTVKQIPELSGLGLEYLGEILKNEIKEVKKEVEETIKK